MDHLIQLLIQYRYLILFPLAFIEGPVIALICGFLTRLQVFSFLYVYLLLMAADLLGDAGWYAVGYFWGEKFLKKFGRFFGINEKEIKIVNGFYQKYHNSILLISKLTMGLGLPFVTLVTAGIVKIPFKKYMMLNFLGQLVWSAFLLGIGYYLGQFYLAFYDKYNGFSAIPLFILLFFIVFGVGKYIRSKVMQAQS